MANGTEDAIGFVLPYSTILYSVLAFVGVLLNGSIFGVLACTKVIPGKVPRLFLLNQFFSDTLCCLLLSLAWVTDRPYSLSADVWGTLFCYLIYYRILYWSLVLVAGNNIVLLAVEQYVSVVHPMSHSKFKLHWNVLFIFLCWTTGFARQTGTYFEVRMNGTECVQNAVDTLGFRAFSVFNISMVYVFPLVVLTFCYSRMIFTLKKSSNKMVGHGGQAAAVNPQLEARKRVQRELSYSVCIMGLSFLILFGPACVAYIMHGFNLIELDYQGSFHAFTTGLLNSYFLINPMAYIIRMRSFRMEIIRIFFCGRQQRSGLYSSHGASKHGDATTSTPAVDTTVVSG